MKSPACLLCDADVEETSSHIMFCPKKAVRFFDHCIYDNLQIEMVTTNTHHGLLKLFKETLLAWRQGLVDSIDTRIYPLNIQEAFCEQTQISQKNVVVGQWWSKKWQIIQGDYYKMVNSC